MRHFVVARDQFDNLMIFEISWKRDSQKIEKVYFGSTKFREGKAGYHFASDIIMTGERRAIKALFERV